MSEFVKIAKGRSSRKIQQEFPYLRKKYWGRHFWARGYFVSTVGNVNEETVRKYIQEQEENDKLEDGRK